MLDVRLKLVKVLSVSILTLAMGLVGYTYITHAATNVTDLEQQIRDRKKSVDEVQKKIQIYDKTIRIKQSEAVTLKNEIEIFNDQIDKTELQVKSTDQEVALLAQEIDLANKKLDILEKDINNRKESIQNTLRELQQSDSKSIFEMVIDSGQFSDVLTHINNLEQLNSVLVDQLDALSSDKKDVEEFKIQKDDTIKQKELKKRELVGYKDSLSEQQNAKDMLLAKTKNIESTYQQLIAQARDEQAQIDADIMNLEKEIRKKMASDKKTRELLGSGLGVQLIWPVPNDGISTTFHDPSYPFRRLFEHPAIDIRTLDAQGYSTNGHPVHAAASGYVARVQNGGASGYSYVMIIHSDRLSTVYGHISRLDVKQDTYVAQGQVIGLSGGLPGTPGAGRFTTGPHLHFEVRLDGIPVNPLDYLP